jgi:ubiquinone/menaquinone biosynthesis C-methylase UbiE
MAKQDARLMDAAVSSSNLSGRVAANKAFAGADFDGWMHALVAELNCNQVLDLCCGTGNQLLLYAGRPECSRIVGVDLSVDSLDTAARRLEEAGYAGSLDLTNTGMEQVFEAPDIAEESFTLTSCCYGLYYAEDVPAVVEGMVAHLAPGGSVFIVGPYGPNNQGFFDLLRRHTILPPLVERSASSFMPDELVPFLEQRTTVRTETFVNPVRYPDTDAVIDYWRKTTFHDSSIEEDVRADVAAHVATHGCFVIEKHVMAAIGTV